MRTIIALAVVTATFALGSCFHHQQRAYVNEISDEPYK